MDGNGSGMDGWMDGVGGMIVGVRVESDRISRQIRLSVDGMKQSIGRCEPILCGLCVSKHIHKMYKYTHTTHPNPPPHPPSAHRSIDRSSPLKTQPNTTQHTCQAMAPLVALICFDGPSVPPSSLPSCCCVLAYSPSVVLSVAG